MGPRRQHRGNRPGSDPRDDRERDGMKAAVLFEFAVYRTSPEVWSDEVTSYVDRAISTYLTAHPNAPGEPRRSI
jgi:hypothetical protein